MRIAITNYSKQVSVNECARMASVCTKQLVQHAGPAWGRFGCAVSWYKAKEVPADACEISIFDTPDQAGALGYHSESPRGKIYGKVFVNPVLDEGGFVLSGSLSVASVLSHEVLEMWADPFINFWADMTDGKTETALELCDAVEGDSYEIDDISVSNFVLPSWFDFGGKKPFDYLGKLSKPFTMSPGGYMVIRRDGLSSQVFGARGGFHSALKGSKYWVGSRTERRKHLPLPTLIDLADSDSEITQPNRKKPI